MMSSVCLIPTFLSEDAISTMHPYLLSYIKNCQVFFAENERTSRRFFKQLWKEFAPGESIEIDDYEWFTISEEKEIVNAFKQKLKENKTIGIVSEAGCPGIADPGQRLVAIAQEAGVTIKPLVGPNSILLALMASGLEGQRFEFLGYLPIETAARTKSLKDLESASQRKNCTQIFIETPYRNNQLIESILKTCNNSTRLCIAADLTGKNEWIKTRSVGDWKKEKVDIHKRPAIFLILA